MRLTPKQEKFCLVYLETGNASEAYRQAYSTRRMSENSIYVEASKKLKLPNISLRLKKLNEAAVTAAVMTRTEALERLSQFARIDLADLVEFASHELGEDENGSPIIQTAWQVRDSALQDPKALAAITELNASRDGIKIKVQSQIQAIQQLGRFMGWESATKHEHSGPDGQPIRTQIETVDAAVAEGLAAKLVD